MKEFTKAYAKKLAKRNPNYTVKVIRKRRSSQMDGYGVWDKKSGHWVEFEIRLDQ